MHTQSIQSVRLSVQSSGLGPPLDPKGRSNTRLRVRTGQKAWHAVYSVMVSIQNAHLTPSPPPHTVCIYVVKGWTGNKCRWTYPGVNFNRRWLLYWPPPSSMQTIFSRITVTPSIGKILTLPFTSSTFRISCSSRSIQELFWKHFFHAFLNFHFAVILQSLLIHDQLFLSSSSVPPPPTSLTFFQDISFKKYFTVPLSMSYHFISTSSYTF